MGVHSGKWAVLNDRSTVRNWSINDTADTKPYVASNTQLGTGRTKGNRDWTGSYAIYGPTPIDLPGTSFTFLGYTAPNNDTTAGTGATYGGTAVVEQIEITWDWASGGIIESNVTFGGNSALAHLAAQAALTDVTVPTAVSVLGTKVHIEDLTSGSSSFSELPNVANAKLTLKCELKPFVNSSTAGQTNRRAGPLDMSLELTLHNDDRVNIPYDINDQIALRIDADAAGATYWELDWLRVKDFTGFTIDRESGNIIQVTSLLEMDGIKDSDGSVGFIKAPGAVQWWP